MRTRNDTKKNLFRHIILNCGITGLKFKQLLRLYCV